MAQQFFYDNQIRRFLIQFIRVMSNFQVEFGKQRDGNTTLQRVPVFYGDASRQASQILKGNSENTMQAVPAMAAYISSLTYDQSRMQEPNHVSKLHFRERKYDNATGTYTNEQGDAYTVERLMPVPYKLGLKLDIWTSNTEQKLQLIEQIATLFNPSLEIQSTDNYIDWTSLSVINLGDIVWSSRSVPIGTEDPIDIASMSFDIPIWISTPIKVKKLGVIQKMIANMYDAEGNVSTDVFDSGKLLMRKVLTPMDYGVVWQGNSLSLVKYSEHYTGDDVRISLTINKQSIDNWRNLINLYGSVDALQLTNGTSEIRFQQDDGSEVVGTVAYHPTDDTKLLYTPFGDTLPSNTVGPINAIIDPFKVDVNASILDPAPGTRYLILNDIGSFDNDDPAPAWAGEVGNNLVAHTNDIIEYNGTRWSVSFDSRGTNVLQYVTNLATGIQYKWLDQNWIKSVEGVYRAGSWSLVL